MGKLILVLIFCVMGAGSAAAFTFQLQNNLDELAYYRLVRLDFVSDKYFGPMDMAGGEIEQRSSIRLKHDHKPGIYSITWWAGELVANKQITVEPNVTATVIIEFNYPSIDIEVIK